MLLFKCLCCCRLQVTVEPTERLVRCYYTTKPTPLVEAHPFTESHWDSLRDIRVLLQFLRHGCNQRKLRLFACACARRVLSFQPTAIAFSVLEHAEQLAEGCGSEVSVNTLKTEAATSPTAAWNEIESNAFWAVYATLSSDAWESAYCAATSALEAVNDPEAEQRIQIGLLRDIVGHPFPVR